LSLAKERALFFAFIFLPWEAWRRATLSMLKTRRRHTMGTDFNMPVVQQKIRHAPRNSSSLKA